MADSHLARTETLVFLFCGGAIPCNNSGLCGLFFSLVSSCNSLWLSSLLFVWSPNDNPSSLSFSSSSFDVGDRARLFFFDISSRSKSRFRMSCLFFSFPWNNRKLRESCAYTNRDIDYVEWDNKIWTFINYRSTTNIVRFDPLRIAVSLTVLKRVC